MADAYAFNPDRSKAPVYTKEEIDQYCDRSYETVADMQADATLTAGMIAHTLGFHAAGDGGAAWYQVTDDATANGMDIIALENGLYVELIYDDELNIIQLGAKADNSLSVVEIIDRAFSLVTNVYIPEGTYKIDSTIVIPSEKNLIGTTNLENREYGSILNSVGYDVTIFQIFGLNNNIENLNIIHSYTQSEDNPIIDFSGARYLKLKNIILSKDDNTQVSQCIGLYSNPTSPNWTGYVTIDGVVASLYKHCIYVKSSLACFYNCVFNGSSDENLVLLGEVFSFINCDISKNTSRPQFRAKAFTYDGQYGLLFVGCYFENFYTPFHETANNTPVRFLNCKYSFGTTTNSFGLLGKQSEFEGFDLLNYSNGFHSSCNLIKNGSFNKDLLFWSYSGMTLTKDTTDAPYGYSQSYVVSGSNGSMYQKLDKPLKPGKCTFTLWFKNTDISSAGYFVYQITNNAVWPYSSIELRRVSKSDADNGWLKYVFVANIPDDGNDYQYIMLYKTLSSDFKIAGLGLYGGEYFENDTVGNSCNENSVLTENLVLKGSNGNYYQIIIDSNGVLGTQLI